MSHTDLILVISLITFSSTVGVFILIKKINQCTPTPENVLTRRGDIELPTISPPSPPTQPLEAYLRSVDSLDISNYNLVNNDLGLIQYREINSPQEFYRNYNELENSLINSCLEYTYFNSEIIIGIILFIIISLFLILLKNFY